MDALLNMGEGLIEAQSANSYINTEIDLHTFLHYRKILFSPPYKWRVLGFKYMDLCRDVTRGAGREYETLRYHRVSEILQQTPK